LSEKATRPTACNATASRAESRHAVNADGRVGSGAALSLAVRAPGINQLAGRRDLVNQGNEMAACRRSAPFAGENGEGSTMRGAPSAPPARHFA